jgi:transcriptional regulator with XRE-family HTH domain
MNYEDLGRFVRMQRERLTPEAAGLPTGLRRRTPGLRREELAQLCQVSPTWITWIEQGRAVHAAADTLARLARALRLDPARRRYLFQLAGRADPEPGHDAAAYDAAGVMASVGRFSSIAYVLNRRWDVLAWNAPAARLFGSWLSPAEGKEAPNLLAFTFLDPTARDLIPDWDERARRLVAEFRADLGPAADDAEVDNFVHELCERSQEFANRWRKYEVTPREGGVRRFRHPHDGALSFQQVTFQAALRPDLKLVLLLPDEVLAREALESAAHGCGIRDDARHGGA